MSVMASQITSLTIVYSNVYSGADQRKHQTSASLAFVQGIHQWPVNSPHKGPVTREMFPFNDIIMWMKPIQTCPYCMGCIAYWVRSPENDPSARKCGNRVMARATRAFLIWKTCREWKWITWIVTMGIFLEKWVITRLAGALRPVST